VLTPVLEECVGDQGGSVRLAKLDVTKHMDTAAQLNISAIPAVFAFSHGNIVESFVGGLPKHQVEKFIKTAQLHHARVSATASPSPSSQ
jgi:thioredoxin-like negative regulator of GroEL